MRFEIDIAAKFLCKIVEDLSRLLDEFAGHVGAVLLEHDLCEVGQGHGHAPPVVHVAGETISQGPVFLERLAEDGLGLGGTLGLLQGLGQVVAAGCQSIEL
jgi:hypothetical protein